MNQDIRHKLVDIIESHGLSVTLNEMAWITHDLIIEKNNNDANTALNSIGIAVDMARRNE